MKLTDFKRKFKKGVALLYKFIKNPQLTYDDFFQFEFEKKKGIITRGFVKDVNLGIPIELNPHSYVPGGNIYLKILLKKMKIQKSDTIIDLGCGLGSPMLYMMRFPFTKISGVEYSKELFKGCQNNLDKLTDSRINVFYGDAGDFNYFDEYNYIFMYNPFGTVTMKRVLERIMRSYTKNKRIITVIYKNPIFHKLIIETGIFHKISEFNTEDNFKFFVYRTE